MRSHRLATTLRLCSTIKTVRCAASDLINALMRSMSGMGREDIERISALIKSLAAHRTVLMVEHNLSVVANLCDRITVLSRGEILAEGDYKTVSADPIVREAYLGTGHG